MQWLLRNWANKSGFFYENLGKGVEMTSPLKKQIGVYFWKLLE